MQDLCANIEASEATLKEAQRMLEPVLRRILLGGPPDTRAARRFGTVDLAIAALWPHGVPDQATLPNKQLRFAVRSWLQRNGLPDASDATIDRCAGRR